MELLTQFGFEPIQLVAQIVNFLIILFVLKKFLYKPILSMLDKREKAIAEGIEKTEEARIRLEKVAQEEKAILRQAQQEAKKMLEDAKNTAEKTIKDAQTHAAKQTATMIADAKSEIAIHALETEKRLSTQVSHISVEFLKKALSSLFTDKNQEEIMDKAIREIRKKSN